MRSPAVKGKPKLCLVTQYYVPELGAPQTRLSELAVRLTDEGWDVRVLTAVPNYPTGVVRAPYKAWRSSVEDIHGVNVARVPLFTASGSGAKRMLCFISFAVSAAFNGPRLLSRPDIMIVESPPLTIAASAWALKTMWRCPYVLNVSDLWPDSAVRLGALRPGKVLAFAEWLERRAYRKAIAVTGQSAEILAHVKSIANGTSTHEVTNGVDPDRFGPHLRSDESRNDLGSKGELPVFAFAGLVGLAQGLDQVLSAAEILRRNILIYGLGGIVAPFVGIKLIDTIITSLGVS